MKYLVLIMLFNLVSCGKEGGGKGNGQPVVIDTVETSCKTLLDGKDLFELALQANRARIECGIEEDVAVGLYDE